MRKHSSIYKVLMGITFPMLLLLFILCSPQPASAQGCFSDGGYTPDASWDPATGYRLQTCPNAEVSATCYLRTRDWTGDPVCDNPNPGNHWADPPANCGYPVPTAVDTCDFPAWIASVYTEWQWDDQASCWGDSDDCLCDNETTAYTVKSGVFCSIL